MARMTLTELGRKHSTDKVDGRHTFRGQSYMDVYDKYFAKWREGDVSLLEIGVKKGASLRVWEDYFTHARIVGFDYDARCANINFKRARIIVGDQEKQEDLDRAVALGGDGFDIIIDDGSHVNRLTLATFKYLWPKLNKGGLYILEDMKCTYLGDRLVSEQKRGGWRGKNIPETEVNDRAGFDRLLLELLTKMDHLSGNVRAIHLHPMTYVLEKV